MTVTDYKCELRGLLAGGDNALLRGDRVGRIQRPLVQRSVGANRQRHHARQNGDNGDRAAGDRERPYIHRGSFPVGVKTRKVSRANSSLVSGVAGGGAVKFRAIFGTATNRGLTP